MFDSNMHLGREKHLLSVFHEDEIFYELSNSFVSVKSWTPISDSSVFVH